MPSQYTTTKNPIYATVEDANPELLYSVPVDDNSRVVPKEHIYESVDEVLERMRLEQTEVKLRKMSLRGGSSGGGDAALSRKAFHRRSLQVSSSSQGWMGWCKNTTTETAKKEKDLLNKSRRKSMILESKSKIKVSSIPRIL